MSRPVALTRYPKPSIRARAEGRIAVGFACVLGRLSPRRIRTILLFLRRGAAPADARQAEDAVRTVVAVSVLCAGRHCLQRSLAAALLCRIRGVWATWCSGVRGDPFIAHAWIEVAGQPIEEYSSLADYRTLIQIGPLADITGR